MSYLAMNDIPAGLFDADAMEKAGLELTAAYNAGQPYPHIVIDDFVPPRVLEMCLEQFPSAPGKDGQTFDRAQERLKTSFNPDHLSAPVRGFFYSLNSRPFIRFLENLTGIKGLIPDPYYAGAGFHEIKNGGHLSVHADFNHHKPLDLERRINVLIYLNKDWQDGYGGQLELWADDMSKCEKSVMPLFNRAVVFNTTSTSNHGNPNVVNHPDGTPRRSIALYYYTATWSDEKRARTTQFRPRDGTADKPDVKVKRDEMLRDILPPALYRGIKRVEGRLAKRK